MKQNNLFYFKGHWFDNNPNIIGPDSHAFWMSSVVFDGARAFNGLIPDLNLHCIRLIESAQIMGLYPPINEEKVFELCCEGLKKLPLGQYYIRPAFYAEKGFVTAVPESTCFVLAILEMPLPEFASISVCLSSLRRPGRDMAPTEAKASCLYPNSARALREANARGFDNAIIKDPNGSVVELATANLWFVKKGRVVTPAENGTFLSGITRNRIKKLLHTDGVEIEERTVDYQEILNSDEAFSTGNYAKVTPIGRVEERKKDIGPVTRRARELYMDWAQGFPIP